MLFEAARDALCHGKYVARSAWKDGSYLVFLPGMVSVFKVVVQPAVNVGNYLWLMADFLADDWQVYTSREEVPPPHQE
jgi:hypothetical protein